MLRVLMGSDTLMSRETEQSLETYALYKEKILDKLLPPTRGKLLFTNYENAIVAARPKVGAFKKIVLPEIMLIVDLADGPKDVDVDQLRMERNALYKAECERRPDNTAFAAMFAEMNNRFRRPLEPT